MKSFRKKDEPPPPGTRQRGSCLRKRIEENFGWMKAFGNFRKSRWIGAEKTNFVAQFVGAECNLMGMAKRTLAEANLPLRPAAA